MKRKFKNINGGTMNLLKMILLIIFVLNIFLISCTKEQKTNLDENVVKTEQKVNEKKLASDCPRGLIKDPEPGQCGLYVDQNNNNFCNYSEIN